MGFDHPVSPWNWKPPSRHHSPDGHPSFVRFTYPGLPLGDVPAFLQWVSGVSGMTIREEAAIPLNLDEKVVNTISDKMVGAEEDAQAEAAAAEEAVSE